MEKKIIYFLTRIARMNTNFQLVKISVKAFLLCAFASLREVPVKIKGIKPKSHRRAPKNLFRLPIDPG
jgi:hypothetical protein